MFRIDLRDRVTFVTGGARGIGRTCAEALAQAGSHVAVSDLDLGDAERTAREIAAQNGVTARAYAATCAIPAPCAPQSMRRRATSARSIIW